MGMGLDILHSKEIWHADRWHDPVKRDYLYDEMDKRRQSFMTRLYICVFFCLVGGISGLVLWPNDSVVALTVLVIFVAPAVYYYQNTLAHYFADRYTYELEVVDNSHSEITENEAAEYIDIILTRRELDRVKKRIRRVSHCNFLKAQKNDHEK